MSYECLVCKKLHEMGVCPRCKFPMIEIMGGYDEGLQGLMPMIQEHRRNFYKSITIGMVIYRWKDDGGIIVADRKDKIAFGTAQELHGNEYWMKEKFARIPNQKELCVTCYISVNRDNDSNIEREIEVKLPNLLEAELQQIGIKLSEDDSFVLLLKNDLGNRTESENIKLFAD